MTTTPPEPPSPPKINHKELIDPLAYREPRCDVCRDEDLRVRVDELLRFRGFPVLDRRGGCRSITYAEIWRSLGATSEEAKPVSYSSLWNHATRHYGRTVTPEVLGALLRDMLVSAVDADDGEGT